MLRLCTALVAGMACASLATAQVAPHPKLGTQLTNTLAQQKAPVDLLIYMQKRADLAAAKELKSKKAKTAAVVATLRATAMTTQQDLLATFAKAGIETRSFFIVNAVLAKQVPVNMIDSLLAREDIGRVIGNPKVRAVEPTSKAQLVKEPGAKGPGANISRTGAPDIWAQGFTGQGIVVAGQDTGIDWDHPSLIDQYRGQTASGIEHSTHWWDAIRSGSGNSCGFATEAPCDDHGHGTHTLGTVVGDDGDGNQVGMAPGSKWIGCRNMDDGIGQPSTYIDCFQFFLAPWPADGDPMTDGDPAVAADVINNSWGCPRSEGCEGDEFLPVLDALEAAGIMVVAAAGNAGSSCSSIEDGPAHHSEETLAVGASDHRNDSIASFSSRGPSAFDSGIGPDIAAPGVSVRSAIPGGGYSGSWWSGTSMASPHVAGAVALMWSAVPELHGDIDETIRLLRVTADAQTSSQTCGGVSGQEVPNNTFGHGILNVKAAIESARSSR